MAIFWMDCSDLNLVIKMIKEKDTEIAEVTKDVSHLQT